MPTTSWKGIERDVSRLFEGNRVPSSGNGAIKGDVVQMRLIPDAIAEVKHGQHVLTCGPKKLMAWLAEAERDARTASARCAILVLHGSRQHVDDSLVVVRAKDLRDTMLVLREREYDRGLKAGRTMEAALRALPEEEE